LILDEPYSSFSVFGFASSAMVFSISNIPSKLVARL
jgi:hypothetical protein